MLSGFVALPQETLLRDNLETYMYSMVPQKVCVVASPNRDSLLRPKSVKTTWPYESNIIFSGFRSLHRAKLLQ